MIKLLLIGAIASFLVYKLKIFNFIIDKYDEIRSMEYDD